MKKRIWLAVLPLAALLLELLPGGVKMRFMAPPGQAPTIKMTSYFDLLPFGYANFAPLITAILTCVLLGAVLLYAVMGTPGWCRFAKYTALIAAAVSVCPVFMGAYTLIGGIISALLLCQMVWLFRMQS